MNLSNVETIVSIIFMLCSAGIIAAGHKLLLRIFKKIYKKILSSYDEEGQFRKGMFDVISANRCMEDLLRYGADRIILFSGQNCGGIPAAGKPYSTTAIDCVGNFSNKYVIRQYQGLAVDGEYVEMVMRSMMAQDKLVNISTKLMPRCQLKELYEYEGIEHTLMIYLGVKDRKLLYITVSTGNPLGFTKRQRTAIKILIHTLRRLVMK